MQLNVNTKAVRKYASRLEYLSKSALPVAIRQTLNSAAFDVKTMTMPKAAKDTFTERKKTFFKATSKVETATGFNVSSMKSTVGFKKTSGQGVDKAVEDLKQQEDGGSIGGRSFIVHDRARVGKSRKKNVRPVNRTTVVKNIVNANKVRGAKNKSQKFIRAAFYAANKYGANANVMAPRENGISTVFRIKEIWGSTRRQGGDSSRKLDIRAEAIMSYKKGRKVSVKGTGFMKEASEKSARKMEKFFGEHAKDQVKKFYNR